MADDKKAVEPITLVATQTGFAMGRSVYAGERFLFAPLDRNGNKRKLPKWAVLAEEFKGVPKKPVAGDLKPKDAQAAVKAKAGALTGNTETP